MAAADDRWQKLDPGSGECFEVCEHAILFVEIHVDGPSSMEI